MTTPASRVEEEAHALRVGHVPVLPFASSLRDARDERADRAGEDRAEVVDGEEPRAVAVRRRDRRASACSVGRKTLTSPADGLSVPTTAITSSGQNQVTLAKPMPVATMIPVAASSSVAQREAVRREPEAEREHRRAEQRAR